MVIAMCFGLRSCLFIVSAVQLLSQSNVESVKERLVSSCFYNNYICLVLTLTAADVRSLISDIMMSVNDNNDEGDYDVDSDDDGYAGLM